MTSTTQLFLLSDHLKLSLYELQRAQSLSLDVESDKMREMKSSLRALIRGIEDAEKRLGVSGALSSHELEERDKLTQLRLQYQDLRDQITSVSPAGDVDTEDIEDEEGDDDDSHQRREAAPPATTTTETIDEDIHRSSPPPLKQPVPQRPADISKHIPTDSPRGPPPPYRDSPSPIASPEIDNQQLHAHNNSVMDEQDEQLDLLSQSVGRQRALGIQIGDELDGQVELLGELEGQVDRNVSGLGRARTRMDRVHRGGGDGLGGSTGCGFIVGLIVILIVLVVLLK